MSDLNGHDLNLGRDLGRLMERSDQTVYWMERIDTRLSDGDNLFRHHHGRITALEQRPHSPQMASKSPPHSETPPGWEKVALQLGAWLITLWTAIGTGTLGTVAKIAENLASLSGHGK